MRFRTDSSVDSVNSSTKSSAELNEVDAFKKAIDGQRTRIEGKGGTNSREGRKTLSIKPKVFHLLSHFLFNITL